MHFKSFHSPLLLLLTLLLHIKVSAGASNQKPDLPVKMAKPCTISSATGAFYDLTELRISLPKTLKKPLKHNRVDDWKARGYDYHNNQANFTLNICGPIAQKQANFVGVEEHLWQNVSAFYELGSERFSIGQENTTLLLRGRRLVLEYRNGSPCREQATNLKDGNDLQIRRKSSLISFHCDKDPLAAPSSALVTYVGSLDDECSYHFEVLSKVACVTSEPAKQLVGPGAVFALICIIAVLVYFIGGIFYQRNVAHARGWRQLPNYSIWAGIGSSIKDIFIILSSSCMGLLPNRRRYTMIPSGRLHRRAEDENRLIDQLDEEWDD
ncbi:putative mannose 6-phosphate receptor-like protein [Golovinomyces cichoracearum]|uniref:Putative mannose 6-phosphate receptor-like protein n=1 Tax=Golovinomyces cichoracearum TaxID=62708 RepID=A0A420IQC3_9PEZI|nr:putative mannose 6-phosphate receptor-like protein [Golovinomyces cichoracearum]